MVKHHRTRSRMATENNLVLAMKWLRFKQTGDMGEILLKWGIMNDENGHGILSSLRRGMKNIFQKAGYHAAFSMRDLKMLVDRRKSK